MWKKSIPTHRSQKPKCYRKVISIKLNWNVQRGEGTQSKKIVEDGWEHESYIF